MKKNEKMAFNVLFTIPKIMKKIKKKHPGPGGGVILKNIHLRIESKNIKKEIYFLGTTICTCNLHYICTCNLHYIYTCNLHYICTCNLQPPYQRA